MGWPSMQTSSTGQTGPVGLCCGPASTQALIPKYFELIYLISQWESLLWPGTQTTVSA